VRVLDRVLEARAAPHRSAAEPWAHLPLPILLLAALVFHAQVLFTRRYLIPWDFRGFHLPLAAAVFDAMKGAGSILWDTSTYCGRPLFADPQAQVFYPPTALTIFISSFFDSAWLVHFMEWELVLHIFAAGAFAYLMLRRMRLSRPAALCGGLVFELGGFFASQTQHAGAIEGAAWVPLMWAAVWELRSAIPGRWFAILAAAGAMTILAGFPAIASTALASTVIYAVILFCFRQMPWRRLAWVVAATVFSVGLSAVMLVPAIQLTFLSVARYRTDWFDGWGLPLASLRSLVWPPDRHQPIDLIYCGLLGLLLALTALFRRKSRGEVAPLGCLTLLAGIWMLGSLTVFGRAVFRITPDVVKGSLYPHFAMAAFCLGIAALAGFGLDRLPSLSQAHKYALALTVAAELIVVGAGRPMNTADTRIEPGFTRNTIDGSAAVLARLHELTGGLPPNRVDTHENSPMWATTAPLIRIATASGYNPMVLERLMQVRLSFAKGERWGAWYEVEHLASPVVDALNVKYLLTGKPIPALPAESQKFVLAAELPGLYVYENRRALPRFWMVHQVRAVHKPEDAFREVHSPDFQPAQVAVVEDGGSGAWNFADSTGEGRGASLQVLSYSARKVDLHIRTATPRFLVSSETNYPGWHAEIDGAQVPIYMANGAFRGVSVPAGDHVIAFRFVPLILWIGVGITVISAVGLWLVYRAGTV
jgi:hypothetical protein